MRRDGRSLQSSQSAKNALLEAETMLVVATNALERGDQAQAATILARLREHLDRTIPALSKSTSQPQS
ncbi:hypothetical protein [Bradyrhizobium sp. DOA9]|uniref:hypothetical protein n=1 Tax=Bradyrhizobium sp. DOA9 TaxID=1126627 RepID=UPI0012601FAE|nr:hypothetical protein [Bradyrhizobium sp. DOA9]